MSISADGLRLAFRSAATNLVAGLTDNNGNTDVFAHDLLSDLNALVSVSSSSATMTALGQSEAPVISADGKHVAFASYAGDHVVDQFDDNLSTDVFTRDLAANITQLVSHVAGDATLAGDNYADGPQISADGSWIAFTSASSNLVAGQTDFNFDADVFIWERATDNINLVSHNWLSSDTAGEAFSTSPSISGDGSVVAFVSVASDLVSGISDTNGNFDIFVWERATNENTLASFSASNSTSSASLGADSPQVSGNGTVIAFLSQSSDLVSGDLNGVGDVFVSQSGAASSPPTATSQSVSTNEDAAKAITLSASDVDSASLTYSVVTNPTHGALTGTAPNLTYTPDADYHGADSFTFKANDGSADSNTATVTITVTPVNDAPAAAGQSVSTNEDTAKAITLSGTDVDDDTLTYSVVNGPSRGSLTGTAPNLTYVPSANYHGADSFTFKVNDGSVDSNTATVSITVSPVNDAPVASGQSVSTNEDTAKAITLSAADVDGDALTYSVVNGPAHGSLTGTAPNLTYTPVANYHGADSFTFTASDGSVGSNSAVVNITVEPVNDAPVAHAESFSTRRATTIDVAAPGVLANDTDGDDNPLTAQLVQGPVGGSFVLNSDGSFRYTPRIGFTGTDTFTYRASDSVATGNTVTVTIAVSVAPPDSTPDAKVEGVGTIAVSRGKGAFSISISKGGQSPRGSLMYLESGRNWALHSTQLTSVVLSGKTARIFGKGKLANGALVDFVVDVADNHRGGPGARPVPDRGQRRRNGGRRAECRECDRHALASYR